MTQGILLFATTHPYYGRMAANFASSVKAVAPDTKIAVVTDGPGLAHLNPNERSLFDVIIRQPDIASGLGGVNVARMSLPYLTPFDETLSIDADVLWLPKADPKKVFELLEDRDITIVNEGFTDLEDLKFTGRQLYTHWADAGEIRDAYGLTGRLYQTRGEFVLFRSVDRVNALFDRAAEIMSEPKVEVTTLAESVTDEFAMNIALNEFEIEPHANGFEPIYWPNLHGNYIPALHKFDPKYFGISFGGNMLSRNAARTYETICRAAARKTGVPFRFPLKDKRYFLTERRLN